VVPEMAWSDAVDCDMLLNENPLVENVNPEAGFVPNPDETVDVVTADVEGVDNEKLKTDDCWTAVVGPLLVDEFTLKKPGLA